jgi:tricorn protease-like protein
MVASQKAEATFPGNNGKIAFVSGRPAAVVVNDAIYSVRPDGTGLRNETDDQYIDAAPAYSPDGRRLAFASRGDIFVKDVGSTEERRLTNSPELDTEPAFSPDGQKIVYSGHNVHYTTDLYTMNAEGTEVKKLTDGGSSPDWSPDGTKIAFSTNGELYVIKPDGTGLKNLTNSPTVMESGPSWSPDGTKIAYARYVRRTREYKIKVMNAVDGSCKTNLVTAKVGNMFDLDWQPRPTTSR